jgi:hypothetical protein
MPMTDLHGALGPNEKLAGFRTTGILGMHADEFETAATWCAIFRRP